MQGALVAEKLESVLGRRKFIKSIAALGAMSSTAPLVGCNTAASQVAAKEKSRQSGEILQPGKGTIRGDHYLPSTPDNVLWGYVPGTGEEPTLRMKSGETLTVDTVSHEGLMEDQGRDPKTWFSQHGVAGKDVLADAVDIAQNYDRTARDFSQDGPHIVSGPVFVEGAMPGDVLKVETLETLLRVPYGVISNRHEKGALRRLPDATAPSGLELDETLPDPLGGNVSVFANSIDGRGLMKSGNLDLSFQLRPFMGMMGVARESGIDRQDRALHSVPPTLGGGNIDIRHLRVGSALYLPVSEVGAMFYTGDPHHAMGDGEVALTAMEGSLRTTFRLTVCKPGEGTAPSVAFGYPFAETEEAWIPIGLSDPDGFLNGQIGEIDVAMRRAVVNALDFLQDDLGIERPVAYAYLSAASDFALSQVVDVTTGVHALIYKEGLPSFR